MDIRELLEYNFINIGGYTLNLVQLLTALVILLGARLGLYAFYRTILRRFFAQRDLEPGRQFAIKQLINYFVYTIALLFALQNIGIQLTVLLGGAAALLVGLGIGIQQNFNDLTSGIILLVEGSVEVGDIVQVGDVTGVVRDIGFRTSKVETWDNIFMIIPNSKLVVDNVINWSHENTPTRFHIRVGVSYGSDVELVTQLLYQAARAQKGVLKKPAPWVQFSDFGNSSLDFDLHFYTYQYLQIHKMRSEIRYRIVELFRANNIEIPFPQRDLWIRNPQDLLSATKNNPNTSNES
ncbi:MAG: potassium transporter KefA [Bacteroidetes bacterium]|nr:MAG: potassium transporter KefA [Bacteroidota bacterium]